MEAVFRPCGTGKPSPETRLARPRAIAGLYLAAAILSLIAACGGGGGGGGVQAPVVPPPVPPAPPQIALVPRYDSLAAPLGIEHAGDNTGRLYIVEQAGRIRLIDNGSLLSAPFLDISTRVVSGGEQGLLGLAFPPGHAASGRFYVNYTRISDGATVIARYQRSADPNVADPNSEVVLLTVPQPFTNHNGGKLAFGPDGFLYIGMGDGGSGGDPQNHAQNPASLLGKMLRIDVEAAPDPGLAYAIPATNPFVQTTGFRGEIWALGLRNPWRFSFDRLAGDLYIGDVGQGAFEEVDFQAAGSAGGENYGWRIMEGTHCFDPAICSQAGLVLPVAEYDHGQGCSVTGGSVYRGQAFPALQGFYLYADFCSGRFWGLKRDGTAWQNSLLLVEPHSISSFGEDEAGNLYAADLAAGVVYEIVVPK
jgi:glucose/arabinose dehydrogenase